MKPTIVISLVLLNLSFFSPGFGQSAFWFANNYPPYVDAPIRDHFGVPLAGTGYLAELWGGSTPDSLAPLILLQTGYPRLIKPFTTGGYVSSIDGGWLIVPTMIGGDFVWLEMRAWDASLGSTYEEVAALGIGGYGESAMLYLHGTDPTMTLPDAPAFLIGLQSFSLRPVVPEPSTWGLLTLGGMALWCAAKRRT